MVCLCRQLASVKKLTQNLLVKCWLLHSLHLLKTDSKKDPNEFTTYVKSDLCKINVNL